MEDAAKAIELAVGVIIFIVALTIGLLLYNKLADTANDALTINNTQNSVIYNENEMSKDFGYIYTPEDIYYFIEDIKSDNNLYEKVNDIFICKGYCNKDNIKEDIIDTHTKVGKIRNNIEANDIYGISDNDSRYKIKYDYEYIEKDVLTELNTHKPREIYIIQYVEDF